MGHRLDSTATHGRSTGDLWDDVAMFRLRFRHGFTTQQYHLVTLLNALTVMQAHVTANDDGCRPPHTVISDVAVTAGACRLPTLTPPVIYISGEDVDEDAGTATFRIALSHVSSQTVGVTVITSDGTANSGSDYGACEP